MELTRIHLFASAAVATVAIAVYFLYQRKRVQVVQSDDQSSQISEETPADQLQNYQIYDEPLINGQRFMRLPKSTQPLPLTDLTYNLIVSLNKGRNFFGKVDIEFKYLANDKSAFLHIGFNGAQIFHVSINRNFIERPVLRQQALQIPARMLNKNQRNIITIIYEGKYSFMDEGIGCYFEVDDENTYQVREKVVYTRNGPESVTKILPCFNQDVPCRVRLSVFHPLYVQAYSNSLKKESRSCNNQDFPHLSFFFENNNEALIQSTQLGKADSELSGSQSSMSADRCYTEFFPVNLQSIHQMFLLCLLATVQRFETPGQKNRASIINTHGKSRVSDRAALYRSQVKDKSCGKSENETTFEFEKSQKMLPVNQSAHFENRSSRERSVSPTTSTNIKDNLISLKFHYKVKKEANVSAHIKALNRWLHVCARRADLKNQIVYLNVFFLSSTHMHGYFSTGCIILHDKSIKDGLSHEVKYMVARAVVGIVRSSERSLADLCGKLNLNKATLEIFPEFQNLLYIKQLEHRQLIQKLNNVAEQNLDAFQVYYAEQCPFLLLPGSTFNNVLPDLVQMNALLQADNNDKVWEFLPARLTILDNDCMDSLLKAITKILEVPFMNQALLESLRQNIKPEVPSYLLFFTNEEIRDHFDNFQNSKAINQRLPMFGFKNKFISCVKQENQKYLRVRNNIDDCKRLYNKYQMLNEETSCHHYDTLQEELARVRLFFLGKPKGSKGNIDLSASNPSSSSTLVVDMITSKSIQKCGLRAWKLLSLIKVEPQDVIWGKLLEEMSLPIFDIE